MLVPYALNAKYTVFRIFFVRLFMNFSDVIGDDITVDNDDDDDNIDHGDIDHDSDDDDSKWYKEELGEDPDPGTVIKINKKYVCSPR